jgi:hypothetical protein
MSDDSSGLIILVVVVCIILSCIVAVLKINNTPTSSSGLTPEQLSNALNNVNFTQSTVPNVLQYGNGYPGSINYALLENATVKANNLGAPVSKNQNDCDALCHTTVGCAGYTIDGMNCQLKNNVTLVEFLPGASNLYSSRDYNRTLYESFPHGKFDDGLVKSLWNFHGSLADSVSNCQTNDSKCNGFTWDGTSAVMYPSIIGVDASASGTVYTTLDKQPKFVLVPGTSYSDTPTSTSAYNPAWAQQRPFNPTHDSDFFTAWQTGWDAGVDSYGTSNTISVTSLAQCQNACVSNSWCQSFVYDKVNNKCNQRHTQVAWPNFNIDGSSKQRCQPATNLGGGTCPCGVDQNNNFNCNNNIIHAHSGTSNGNTDTYVKLNPPLVQFCAQQCQNDTDCLVSWYNSTSGNCNTYSTKPTNKVADPASTTIWMTNNFPLQ